MNWLSAAYVLCIHTHTQTQREQFVCALLSKLQWESVHTLTKLRLMPRARGVLSMAERQFNKFINCIYTWYTLRERREGSFPLYIICNVTQTIFYLKKFIKKCFICHFYKWSDMQFAMWRWILIYIYIYIYTRGERAAYKKFTREIICQCWVNNKWNFVGEISCLSRGLRDSPGDMTIAKERERARGREENIRDAPSRGCRLLWYLTRVEFV